MSPARLRFVPPPDRLEPARRKPEPKYVDERWPLPAGVATWCFAGCIGIMLWVEAVTFLRWIYRMVSP